MNNQSFMTFSTDSPNRDAEVSCSYDSIRKQCRSTSRGLLYLHQQQNECYTKHGSTAQWDRNLVTKDMENTEQLWLVFFVCLFFFFFATPVFTRKFCPNSQFRKSTSTICGNATSPIAKKDIIKELLSQLYMQKPIGSDRMYLTVLRKFANVTVGPLYVIFEESWHEKGFQWLEKYHTYIQDGKHDELVNYRPVCFISTPRSNLPGVHSQLQDDQKVNSQHGFIKGKPD